MQLLHHVTFYSSADLVPPTVAKKVARCSFRGLFAPPGCAVSDTCGKGGIKVRRLRAAEGLRQKAGPDQCWPHATWALPRVVRRWRESATIPQPVAATPLLYQDLQQLHILITLGS